ncbi:MAG: shikimate kinase AroL [Planctomycetota bacterium]|jgi:shikimate kinase|nr:shikimate kinase AroL [Planctomycetota bacterium]
MQKLIFLIGARGSGKTTLGELLATKLGVPFHDSDQMVEAAAGMTVAQIVAKEGWGGFRRRESTAVVELANGQGVVASGGGAVLSSDNCRVMREHGWVIYLQAPAQVLAERLKVAPQDDHRPSLTGKGMISELAETLRQRESLYVATADWCLDASQPLETLLADAMTMLEIAGKGGELTAKPEEPDA